MKATNKSIRLAALAGAIAAFAPLAASAQNGLPSYATAADETVRGTITSFDGAHTVYVRDAHGYIDHVTLRDGTIINPTGLRLEPGMSVTVLGRTQGSTFAANEIDTPYHREYPVAYAVPAYPEPYYYGYGPESYGYGSDYRRADVGFYFGGGHSRYRHW